MGKLRSAGLDVFLLRRGKSRDVSRQPFNYPATQVRDLRRTRRAVWPAGAKCSGTAVAEGMDPSRRRVRHERHETLPERRGALERTVPGQFRSDAEIAAE